MFFKYRNFYPVQNSLKAIKIYLLELFLNHKNYVNLNSFTYLN